MRFYLLILLGATSTHVLAQTSPNNDFINNIIPACVRTCYGSEVLGTTCAIRDYPCQCTKMTTLTDPVCVKNYGCTSADTDLLAQDFASMCASLGVATATAGVATSTTKAPAAATKTTGSTLTSTATTSGTATESGATATRSSGAERVVAGAGFGIGVGFLMSLVI